MLPFMGSQWVGHSLVPEQQLAALASLFYPIALQCSVSPIGWTSIESESAVAWFCTTLCDSMDCNLPASSIHGIFQARMLEWVAISFSRRSSWPRDWTWGLPHCRQMLSHLSHQGSRIKSVKYLHTLENLNVNDLARVLHTHTQTHTHTHYMEEMDQVKLFLLINTVILPLQLLLRVSLLFFSFFFFFFQEVVGYDSASFREHQKHPEHFKQIAESHPSVSDILVLGWSLNIGISNKLVQKYIWPMNNWGVRAFSVAQMVRNPPAMQKTWVWSLIWEDLLEKGTATQSSILTWKTSWTEEPEELQFMGL